MAGVTRMVVLIVEKVRRGLRGELSRWMIEPRTGVFVGTLSALVRDRLWEKVTRETGEGGSVMLFSAASEQGFAVRTCGETQRDVVDYEGLLLVRMPSEP